MKTSDAINEIGQAMSKAQGMMKPALKDGLNPHFRSKYSNITSVWEALRVPICNNGLTVWQDITTSEKTVSVTTRIVHSSGQWVEFGPLCIPVNKADAQGFGSATSYAKRYALCAAIGIVSDDDDDDGEKAMQRHVKPDLQEPVKPECTKEEVDTLLELVKQTPKERQDNFNKILASKGWADPYKMSLKFCQFQTDSARVLLASKSKEEEALPF